MSFFFFDQKNKYQVDYCGQKDLFNNAKDSYKEGTVVKVYFDLIATDTDYTFYLDDQPVHVTYDSNKGYVIEFVMPNHDVKLSFDSKQSMIAKNVYLEYSKTVYTADGESSYGFRITALPSDDEVEVDVFKIENNVTEFIQNEILSISVLDECLNWMKQCEMDSWNTIEDAFPLEDTLIICSYDYNGDYYQISSQQMPKNGKSMMEEIEKIINKYLGLTV